MAIVTRLDDKGILSTYKANRINVYNPNESNISLGVHCYADGSINGVDIGKRPKSEENFTISTAKMMAFTSSNGVTALQVSKFITELFETEMENYLVKKEELATPEVTTEPIIDPLAPPP